MFDQVKDAFPIEPVFWRNVNGNGQAHDAKAPAARATLWLRNAMIALAVLATAAAVVSYAAQYRLVQSVKHFPAVAALEAGIPDAGALVFAALGIALALHAKRAIRARLLNLGCIALSVTMNALASGQGWRDLAVWIMPSVVYALASDTLIGVIRAWVIARKRDNGEVLADDQTPLNVLGRILLYGLRFALAAPSTWKGMRYAVLEATPLPGRPEPPKLATVRPALQIETPPARRTRQARDSHRDTGPSKKAVLLDMYRTHPDYGVRAKVAAVASELAPAAGYATPGTARAVLAKHLAGEAQSA